MLPEQTPPRPLREEEPRRLFGVCAECSTSVLAANESVRGMATIRVVRQCACLAATYLWPWPTGGATDPMAGAPVPAVDRSRSYPDVAQALTPLPAAPQGIAGDVTTGECDHDPYAVLRDCRGVLRSAEDGIDGAVAAALIHDIDAVLECDADCRVGSLAGETEPKEPCGDCNKLRAEECAANGCVVQQLGEPESAFTPLQETGFATMRANMKKRHDVGSSAGERAPDGETPEPDDATLLKDLEDSYRADHHFANIADHPAMKDRVDRDVEGAIEPIAARFAALRASLSTAQQALLTAHEDRAKAEAEREALRSAVQAIVTRAEYTGLAHGPLDDIRALLRRPDGGGTT